MFGPTGTLAGTTFNENKAFQKIAIESVFDLPSKLLATQMIYETPQLDKSTQARAKPQVSKRKSTPPKPSDRNLLWRNPMKKITLEHVEGGAEAILEAIRKNPNFLRSELAEILGISRIVLTSEIRGTR